MSLPLPVQFHQDLSSDRLTIISNLLLEEFYRTEDDLSSDVDDNYTRACTRFGRQKNRILKTGLSKKYSWLSLVNAANDLVFCIGTVPCRFSNDDPRHPTKSAVLTVNQYQLPFLEDSEMGDPCRFCFIIDRGLYGNHDPRVVFIGYDAAGAPRCQWESDAVRVLRSAGSILPAPVPIGKPPVGPKRSESDDVKPIEQDE
jgi:hypothetical protein